jgi:hypothetical protein
MGNVSTRAQVYDALDTERKYQDEGRGNAKYELKSIGDFLSAFQVYMNDALASYKVGDSDAAIDDIRKITALGVQGMEKLGARRRLLPEVQGSGVVLYPPVPSLPPVGVEVPVAVEDKTAAYNADPNAPPF